MPENKCAAVSLCEALSIQPGTTSVIGGGGKSSLLLAAGKELAQMGKLVLLCTSTHFLPMDDAVLCLTEDAGELADTLAENRLVQTGCLVSGTAKLGPPSFSFERLESLCDYLLVEADGSAGFPMKAHAPQEPVIPACSGQTIAVVGASGFDRTITEAAHRPALFAQAAGLLSDAPITPHAAAAVLGNEGLHTRVYVNQVETVKQLDQVRELAQLLDTPLAGGALRHPGRHVLIRSSGP